MNLSECLNSFIVHSHCCSQLSEFLSQCLQQNNSSKNLENITSSLGHTCVSHYNVAAIAFFEYILEFIFPSWHYNYQLLTCNYFIGSPRYQLLRLWPPTYQSRDDQRSDQRSLWSASASSIKTPENTFTFRFKVQTETGGGRSRGGTIHGRRNSTKFQCWWPPLSFILKYFVCQTLSVSSCVMTRILESV